MNSNFCNGHPFASMSKLPFSSAKPVHLVIDGLPHAIDLSMFPLLHTDETTVFAGSYNEPAFHFLIVLSKPVRQTRHDYNGKVTSPMSTSFKAFELLSWRPDVRSACLRNVAGCDSANGICIDTSSKKFAWVTDTKVDAKLSGSKLWVCACEATRLAINMTRSILPQLFETGGTIARNQSKKIPAEVASVLAGKSSTSNALEHAP